jgi:hypothetical protein
MDGPKFDLAEAYALKRMQGAAMPSKASETEPAMPSKAAEPNSEQPHEQAAQAMIDAVSAGDVAALADVIRSLRNGR